MVQIEPTFNSVWFGANIKKAIDRGFGPYVEGGLDTESCSAKIFSMRELKFFDKNSKTGIIQIQAAREMSSRIRIESKLRKGLTNLIEAFYPIAHELNESCGDNAFVRKFYFLTLRAKTKKLSFKRMITKEFAEDLRGRTALDTELHTLYDDYWKRDLDAYLSALAPLIIEAMELSDDFNELFEIWSHQHHGEFDEIDYV